MKLRSQEKLDIIQLRVNLNERQAEMLKQYVVYANTQLGHHFADDKELAVEVFRAFLDGDHGFKKWLSQQNTLDKTVDSVLGGATIRVRKDTKKTDLGFENGLQANAKN